MKYHIFSEPSIPELLEEVNDAIKRGWRPLGGVATSMEQGRQYYTQAVTLSWDSESYESESRRTK